MRMWVPCGPCIQQLKLWAKECHSSEPLLCWKVSNQMGPLLGRAETQRLRRHGETGTLGIDIIQLRIAVQMIARVIWKIEEHDECI